MTTDEIVFECPKCETTLRAKSEIAGQQAKCPKCSEVITVPKSSGA
jgi:predicted Zn finger-like uncharacterized protein